MSSANREMAVMPIGTDGLAPIAVVTGGSRGLGRGIAIGLGEAGVNVIITGRDTGALAHTAERVHHVGGRAVPITCDHRDDDQVAAVFGRVAEEYGRLDLLVNNATSFPSVRTLFTPTPFWKTPLSLWDELMTVGLRSHLVAASHAVPVMLGRHGLIVNVSSAAAAVQVPARLRRRQGGAGPTDGGHGTRSGRPWHHRDVSLASAYQHRGHAR